MAMTSFRRSAKHNSANKPKGGGGGNWFDKYKLPQTASTPFVLINAEYVDPNPPPEIVEFGANGQPLPVKNSYYKFRKHKRKYFVNGQERYGEEVCTQGTNPHNPQPCAGCSAMDGGDKSVTVSDTFAFGLVHLHPYHRHPLYDRNNQLRMKGDNSGPIFTYTECEGRTCNFCKLLAGQPPVLKPKENFPPYNPNDIKTEFGHRRYLEIGKSHLSNLEGWEGAVTSQCSTGIYDQKGQLLARCSQQLIQESYNCPTCNSVVIDLSTDPRSNEQLDMAVSKPYPCLKCQKAVMLKEIVACDSCIGQGRTSLQLGVFDVVLWGKRQGEGTKSQMMLSQFQTIEEFQKSLPANMLTLLGGKTVSEIIKELGTPYDFSKVFTPKSIAEQMERLGLGQVQTQGPSSYAQGPQFVAGDPPTPPAGAVPYTQYPQNGPGPTPFQSPLKPNFSK